jgi:negative regulator of flagellin synthesis FlgM
MNIDRVNQNAASGAYAKRTNRAGEVGAAGGPAAAARARAGRIEADGVVLSDEARAIARAEGAARSAPEVREELVARLREQVRNGTYKIQDEQVARRLLDRQA